MSDYGGQQQNWQQQQQYGMQGQSPQMIGQSPQMMQQGVQNLRAPSPVMMQQIQMQNPNQGQMIHSSPPNMQMQPSQQMLISQGQPQSMNGHMQLQNGQQIQMGNGQTGTIVMTSQPGMVQQQQRSQGIIHPKRMMQVYSKGQYFRMQMSHSQRGMIAMPMQHPGMMHQQQRSTMANQAQIIAQQQPHAQYQQQPLPGQQQQFMSGQPPNGGQPQFVQMQQRPPGMPSGNMLFVNQPPQHLQQPAPQQPTGMSPPNLGMRMGPGGPYGQVVVRAQPVQVRVFHEPQLQQQGQQGMFNPTPVLREALSGQISQRPPGQTITSSPISQTNTSSDSMETSPPSTNSGNLMAAPPPAKPPTPRQNTPVPKKTPSKPGSKSNAGISKSGQKTLQPTAMVVKSLHPPVQQSTAKMSSLLDRARLETLMASVDKNETLEDDVAEALLQYVEEYTGNIISSATRLAKHRNANRIEARDVKYVLTREFNVTLPNEIAGNGTNGGPPKRPLVNAHQQRMALIEKVLKKP